MTVDTTWDLEVAWPVPGTQRVYDLAQALEPGMPHHPVHPPYAFTLTKQHGEVMYQEGVSAASELITLGGHVGTHMDGLGHVSKDGRIHGGHDITAAQSYTGGLEHGAIDGATPLIATGFLVDGPRLHGGPLEPGDTISADDLERWFSDRAVPAPGSVVLVWTGWDAHWSDNSTYLGVEDGTPGVDLSAARWLTEHGVRATGADTIAYEALPSPALDVHVHLLVENGVHILEAMHLADLAADEVWEFFFLAIPLRIRGGTGSPIRPLAIVRDGEAT